MARRKETLPVFLRLNCNWLTYGHQLYEMSWVSRWLLEFGRWLAELLSGVFFDPGQPVVDPEEAHLTVTELLKVEDVRTHVCPYFLRI